MSFTKITQTELNQKGATTQPDRPTISAQDLKRVFDAPAKEVVAPAYNRLIDELEATTGAASLGAVAPTGRTGATVQAVINSVSGDLATLEGSVAEAIADAHTHSNKAVIDKLADDGTGLTYDGNPVGAVTSVNSQTGDVVLTASDVGALPDSTTIPTNTSDLVNDSGFITSSDIPSIPTKTSDLVNDSNFVADASYVHTDNNYDATAKGIVDGVTAAIASKSTVAYSQTYTQTGQKIGEITIDGTKTDLVAPSGGGGGGGGAVDSVNGQTGIVVLNQSDINDVTITSLADQHTLVYNANSSIWENEKLADVALTNSYNDLDDQPTIPTITDTYDGTSSDGMSGKAVKQAIDALDVSDSAVSGQYVSAVSETDGKISVTRETLPSIPTVNDATLTIQKNGTNVQTFTANQSTNATANIITDKWHGTTATVSSGSVTFSGVDDSDNNGYDLYIQVTSSSTNKNPTREISSISGEGTSSMSITFTTDADNGATAKLRIIK